MEPRHAPTEGLIVANAAGEPLMIALGIHLDEETCTKSVRTRQ
jgi:hypothetical protein